MPTVTVGDITTYYEVHGDGEPVVFIGGLGADISLYAALLDDLAQCHRVIAFDNRGIGRTSKPDAPYSIGMLAHDTLGLLDALGLDVVDLVGMSMGGRIALELAATHPDRICRLVLISTSAAGTGKIHMSQSTRSLPEPQFLAVAQGAGVGPHQPEDDGPPLGPADPRVDRGAAQPRRLPLRTRQPARSPAASGAIRH